jgi:hypothetical protein
VSLDAGERVDLPRFLPRLVVIRGVLPDGQNLYLTKHYWAYGFKYRAQMLATVMLGPTPGISMRVVQAVRTWMSQRAQDKELTR